MYGNQIVQTSSISIKLIWYCKYPIQFLSFYLFGCDTCIGTVCPPILCTKYSYMNIFGGKSIPLYICNVLSILNIFIKIIIFQYFVRILFLMCYICNCIVITVIVFMVLVFNLVADPVYKFPGTVANTAIRTANNLCYRWLWNSNALQSYCKIYD